MRIALHPEARAELRSAALWYDEQRVGLGDDLVAEVWDAFARISDEPRRFPVWPGVPPRELPIRRALVKRFPYAVAFELDGHLARILAVAHLKRRPLYWLDRAISP